MNVLHVVPTYWPATTFGGPIFSVLGLCDALARRSDVTLRVLTTNSMGVRGTDIHRPPENPMRFSAGYDVHYCRKTWGKEFSLSLLRRLPAMMQWADVVHLAGVYSFPTLPVLALGKLFRAPVLWSPRGSLQTWERTSHPVMKRIWNAIARCAASRRHVLLHCTSAEEASASRARFPGQGTVVIPNGVQPVATLPPREWMPGGMLRILYLGRLHPRKHVENLIEALPLLHRPALLDVCGSGDAEYEAMLRSVVRRLSLTDVVRFHGHVDGALREERFREADVCVLPSLTENFGMVVLEALMRGVPVVASTGTPWSQLPARGCGIWADGDADALARAIDAVAGDDPAAMGARGRRWAMEDFSWDLIAERMHEAYRRLATAEPGARPA